MNAPRLSVVIPVYNEEENLVELIQRCLSACGKCRRAFEIILVDDVQTKDDVLLLLLREAVCEVIQEVTDGASAVFQVRARKRNRL